VGSLREECGVMGVWNDPDAANLVYLGLYALQHRGQEGCGIVTLGDDKHMQSYKALGRVADGITKDKLDKLPGSAGIGHVRYSTFGGKQSFQNIQPFTFNTSVGEMAICHNGNLTNAGRVRSELEAKGAIFQSSSDTEVFMHLLARTNANSIADRLAIVMRMVKGAYSLLLMTEDRLFALRDPFGFRPLVIGKRGDSYVVASETCALDLLDAEFVRDVRPGEIVEITNRGLASEQPLAERKRTFCAFEPIYFSRPDSLMDGEDIYTARKRIGAALAKETSVPADLVIAIPDSGVPMSLGYAAEVGLPCEVGLVRNHYIGRTFIEPSQAIRDFGVRLKLNPVRSVLAGSRVVVVDDSIVRGTTSVKIVRMLREAGAKEIHLRVGSPPMTHSCFFGVDTPERGQLIAAQKDINEMREFIGADTLAFLSLDGLKEAIGETPAGRFCFGCFNGAYPEDICQTVAKEPTDAPGGPGFRSGF